MSGWPNIPEAAKVSRFVKVGAVKPVPPSYVSSFSEPPPEIQTLYRIVTDTDNIVWIFDSDAEAERWIDRHQKRQLVDHYE